MGNSIDVRLEFPGGLVTLFASPSSRPAFKASYVKGLILKGLFSITVKHH